MEHESLEWSGKGARAVCETRRMRRRSGIVAAERKSRIRRRPFKRRLMMIPAVERSFFEHIFVIEKLPNSSRVILTRLDLWTPGNENDIILSPQIGGDYSDIIAIDTPTHAHHSTATAAATSSAGTTTITPVDNNILVVVDDDDDEDVVVLDTQQNILPRPPRPRRPPPPPVGLIVTPLAGTPTSQSKSGLEKRMCGWPASS